MTSFEIRDGEMVEVPDEVITESGVYGQDVTRTLRIAPGVRVTTRGRLSGTLEVGAGAELVAEGPVSGTVSIAPGATVRFEAATSGTISVQRGARAVLGPQCVALGVITVEGELENHGTRGVNVSGRGTITDLPGSVIRQPDETWPDGTTVYRN